MQHAEMPAAFSKWRWTKLGFFFAAEGTDSDDHLTTYYARPSCYYQEGALIFGL